MTGRAAALALAVACSPPPDDTALPPGTPPNVLVVVLDDVGRDKVSAYGERAGGPATPTLDALAAEGVLFRRHYTNILCTPTRAGLLTGRQGYDGSVPYHLWPWDPDHLDPAVTTLPEALPEHTAVAVGKWHLGGLLDQAPLPPHAVEHGFAQYYGNPDNLGFRWDWDGQYESYVHYERLAPIGWSTRDRYVTTDEVDDAIGRVEVLDEPWLLYVALHAPHKPFEAPPDALNPRGVTADSPEVDRYDAMVEATDAELGRLLDALPPAVRARTTVLVASDNGTPLEVSGPDDPWRRAKNTPYEAGIRNPLIVAGYGVRSPGREVDALVSHLDLFATILDLAGSDAERPPESSSFAPLLDDPEAGPTRDTVYVEYVDPRVEVIDPWGNPTAGHGRRDVRMVVRERYKLVVTWGVEELYDLEADPLESTNLLAGELTAAQAAELALLRAEVARHDLAAGR